jgi:hypothetical protein
MLGLKACFPKTRNAKQVSLNRQDEVLTEPINKFKQPVRMAGDAGFVAANEVSDTSKRSLRSTYEVGENPARI